MIETSASQIHGKVRVLNGETDPPVAIRASEEVAPALEPRQVHVWISRTNLPRSIVGNLKSTLSPDEIERATLFRFEERRNQYIVGRGLLRAILARYVGRPAPELLFSKESGGKPILAETVEMPRVQFNLSHSGTLCAIAITSLEMVGIDVQKARPGVDVEAIARRILTGRERAEFERLGEGQRSSWFYSAWSKKEAFVKAKGVGMSMPFQDVEIGAFWRNPSGSPFLKRDRFDFSRWWTQSFVPAAGYSGAVATLGTPSSISYRWDDHS